MSGSGRKTAGKGRGRLKVTKNAICMRIFVEAGRRVYYTVNSAVRTGFFCCIGSYLCEKGVLMYRISHNEGIFMQKFTLVSHLSGIIPDRDKRREAYHV